MKLKNIYLILVALLITLIAGCSLVSEEKENNLGYRSLLENTKTIRLSDEVSTAVYQALNHETPGNAIARQPHTMGDVISGTIVCDNEFVNATAKITEQKCRIIVDITDRGEGG